MSIMNAASAADLRREPRIDTHLQAYVQITEGEGTTKEVTDVSTISRNGAGLVLSRRCIVGRLLKIVLPMPAELRAYDHDSELYPVMGIVQYCNKGMVDEREVYHVGVGFIGKHVPDSYRSDPTQNYRITGMTKDGLWRIRETGAKFQNRKNPRYWLSVGVTISVIRKEDRSITREETFTKNVAYGGAAVASSLKADVGDTVKFACRSMDFYALAEVRNATSLRGGSPTLHLEFKDNKFPIDKLGPFDPASR